AQAPLHVEESHAVRAADHHAGVPSDRAHPLRQRRQSIIRRLEQAGEDHRRARSGLRGVAELLLLPGRRDAEDGEVHWPGNVRDRRVAAPIEQLFVARVDRIDLALVAASELDHHRLPEGGGTHARADHRDRTRIQERTEIRDVGRSRGAHFLAMPRFERLRSFMIWRTALYAGMPFTPPPAWVAELAWYSPLIGVR